VTSILSPSVVTAACHSCATPGGATSFCVPLEKVRQQYELVVLGYVVMPEHVHLLVSEPRKRNLSVALKALKQAVARRLLGSARRRKQDASQLALFRADELPQRFWQRRFYDFNLFTEKKRIEKLRYMHRNPVKRGLVENPEDWRWSSFRQYAFGEKGLVEINAAFPPSWAARKG
jgi:putative transposase